MISQYYKRVCESCGNFFNAKKPDKRWCNSAYCKRRIESGEQLKHYEKVIRRKAIAHMVERSTYEGWPLPVAELPPQ